MPVIWAHKLLVITDRRMGLLQKEKATVLL
jgi:hypothetical protein